MENNLNYPEGMADLKWKHEELKEVTRITIFSNWQAPKQLHLYLLFGGFEWSNDLAQALITMFEDGYTEYFKVTEIRAGNRYTIER